MSEEEIKTDHFKTMEELLKHLKMWETDDDYDAYYRFFCPRCAYEMAHKIARLQKELEQEKEKIFYLPAWVTKKYISKDKIKDKKEFLDKCIDLQWASTNYDEREVEKYQYALEIVEDLLKED